MPHFINDTDKQIFLAVLKDWDKDYDPSVQMVKKPFHSPGYHTTLKGGFTHPTRDALEYALALLDRGGKEDITRSIEIFRKVISLQDTDPSHKTYGIWSWFYEEPLEKMSPPDWNWADFCGKVILQAMIDYHDILPADLLDFMKASVLHACKSIMIRDMGPGYTNISLMGTFVTHTAGEYLQNDEILEYAKKRLDTLYHFNMETGAFREYNSPTYTIIAAEELSRMIRYFRDPDSHSKAEDLNRLCWKCIAEHFHIPTHQWAGPHCRCYDTLQTKPLLYRIQRALNHTVSFTDPKEILQQYTGENRIGSVPLDMYRGNAICPPDIAVSFVSAPVKSLVRRTYIKQSQKERGRIATTWMTGQYALSSFYQSSFWNQIRSILCYFGSADDPAYAHLKVLHDLYDFCSAQAATVQKEGSLISVIHFATNGGDTHCNLDMIKNATIRAKDLRIRLELGGAVEDISYQQESGSWSLKAGNVDIHVSFPCVVNDLSPVVFETHRENGLLYLDAVLYHGEEKEICLQDLRIACGFVFRIKPAGESFDETIRHQLTDDSLTIYLDGKEPLSVSGKIHGDTIANLEDSESGIIGDISYEELMK